MLAALRGAAPALRRAAPAAARSRRRPRAAAGARRPRRRAARAARPAARRGGAAGRPPRRPPAPAPAEPRRGAAPRRRCAPAEPRPASRAPRAHARRARRRARPRARRPARGRRRRSRSSRRCCFGADLGVRTAESLLDAVRKSASGGDAEAGAPGAARGDRSSGCAGSSRRAAPGSAEPLDARPHVILVLGVNGSGKTTTIGKLAARYTRGRSQGRARRGRHLPRRGDRAAPGLGRARPAARWWPGQPGGDPAAVAFDTVKAARARGADVAIIDTAGRLQTKAPLMEELAQDRARDRARAARRAARDAARARREHRPERDLPGAALHRGRAASPALVLTKLDGTAKGGVIVGLADEFGIPVRYVGVGEARRRPARLPRRGVRGGALLGSRTEGRGMSRYVLALDQGTTSSRAILFDARRARRRRSTSTSSRSTSRSPAGSSTIPRRSGTRSSAPRAARSRTRGSAPRTSPRSASRTSARRRSSGTARSGQPDPPRDRLAVAPDRADLRGAARRGLEPTRCARAPAS